MLCSPFSNAIVERFFSQMKVIKTDLRNKINEENLEDLLRIKIGGINLETFDKQFCDKAIDLWHNDKVRRPNQGKRKEYIKRGTSLPAENLRINLGAESDH